MGEVQNKQLIQQAYDDWAAGTGGVFDLLAPDVRWTIVGRSAVAGTYTYTWYLHVRQGAVTEVVAFFDSIEFDALWTRVQPA
jgi:ketosteroid isomerase-like protein